MLKTLGGICTDPVHGSAKAFHPATPHGGSSPINVSCGFHPHLSMQETLTGEQPPALTLFEVRRMANELDSIERRLSELVDALYEIVSALREKD